MEGRYSGWTSLRNGEFQEEDVWSVLEERNEYTSHFLKERNDFTSNIGSSDSSTITPRRLPSASRMIPRSNDNSTKEQKLVQQSAPVNIPDWSKIYGTNTKKGSKNVSFLDEDDDSSRDNGGIRESWDSDEDNDGDELEGNMMPPHEWIAWKLARTQISSFSVCEGAGRTLKGRDLSRLRNAVLSRTGFLE